MQVAFLGTIGIRMPVLTQSKTFAYLECPKRMWLEVCQPRIRVDSCAATASFMTGHVMGDIAFRIYGPEGTGLFRAIKTFLAAMVPELSVKNPEGVRDGGGTQLAYLTAVAQ